MDSFRGPEKRRSKRLGATYQISYKVRDSATPYNISRTKNISSGGMLLMTNQPYARGVGLSLIIRGPFSIQGIEAAGEVFESREVVKGSLYETRVRFSDASRVRLADLDAFIKRRLG